MTIETQHIEPHLISILESVSDPEIPVLSIMDMGVVREAIEVDGVVHVKITPTYSGCPAMDVIGDDIVSAFAKAEANSTGIITSFFERSGLTSFPSLAF